MKVPRDFSGVALAKALSKVGYRVTRQTGSPIRLTTQVPTQHLPAHDPLKVGTLSGILGDVAAHLKITRDELTQRLFG